MSDPSHSLPKRDSRGVLAARGRWLAVGLTLAASACSTAPTTQSVQGDPADNTVDPSLRDVFDVEIGGLSDALVADFNDGDLAFSTPLRSSDGLGPLYTRQSCDSCHSEGMRGPGLVEKLAVVEADGVTPAADQSLLTLGFTVHPLSTDSKVAPILAPSAGSTVKRTQRVGPPILGRGYMEAVLDSEIERMAEEQATRTDGIAGRVNYVKYVSERNTDTRFHNYGPGDQVIGRFGLKARIATIDDFSADALKFDMGITSPMRPDEFPNGAGVTDDQKPGVDVGLSSVNSRSAYIRMLAIPWRAEDEQGAELFASVRCAVCHAPSLKTRADYPIEPIAGVDAKVFTDFLVHRMGAALADGIPANSIDGMADSFEWRTAPLIGLRFDKTFLHDGRAATVSDAIRLHASAGSEANDSIERFLALSASDRAALVSYVEGL